MLVDDRSMRIVNAAVGMYDIMERRVTTVEQISRKRQPLPELDAVYFVSATDATIDQIIADYSNAKKPTYNNAHLFFTTPVTDAQLDRIKKCKKLIARVKTFQEVNLDFLTKETNAFHFDLGVGSFSEIVNRPVGSNAHVVIAKKLVTVCCTLNEYPHIRYKAGSAMCEDIARSFHDQMNEFVAKSPNWWYNGGQGHTDRDRGVMLLVDRCDDPLTPLVHELTYAAMVNDLLPIEGEKITYEMENNSGKKEKRDVLLNDNDALWKDIKGQHIADVIDNLSNTIRDLMSNNAGASALTENSGASLSLSEMTSALKQYPEFRETMAKVGQHMYIAHECMSEFNKQGLLELCELEQTMATGVDAEGKAPKAKKLMDDLIDVMVGLSKDQAVRLIMIYIISQQGIKEEDRKNLFSAAGLSEEEKNAILNLEKIGVTLAQAKAPSRSFTSLFRSAKLKATGTNAKDSKYAISRYVCNLKGVLEELTKDKLSIDDYPSILPLPVGSTNVAGSARSVRRDKANTKWGNSRSTPKFTGGRNIVFVAGGICHSEMRSCEEVMAESGKEIVYGSTHILKPREFLDSVKGL